MSDGLDLLSLTIGAVLSGGTSIGILYLTIRHDAYKEALREHENYLGLVRVMRAEARYVASCIDEIMRICNEPILPNGGVCIPAKRLNEDFLDEARSSIIPYKRAEVVFPMLTRAFRDVVHTNTMLNNYAGSLKRVADETVQRGIRYKPEQIPSRVNTIASLDSCQKTLEELASLMDEQERLELSNPPHWRLIG